VDGDCPGIHTCTVGVGETCDIAVASTCNLPAVTNPFPILDENRTIFLSWKNVWQVPSSSGKEFTIEAWVKRGSSTLTGGIFGYLDHAGIVLFVNNDFPKVGIRRNPVDSSSTPAEPIGCVNLKPTSTECIVASPVIPGVVPLVQNVWTHIAGVLTTENQSSDPNCGAVGSQTPHLAIYINGDLVNCGTTASLSAETPRLNSHLTAIGAIGDGAVTLALDGNAIKISTPFTGAIDEVRYWVSEPGGGGARTEEQIILCMDQKLGVSGSCKVDPNILKGYWRLNEGAGTTICDASGNGFAGSILLNTTDEWDGGWVTGKL
jgi:hypothetical protein